MTLPIRILLSEAASRHLTATGEHAFIVASRAMRGVEEPDTAGRWALWLVPCSITTADAAVRVARGLTTERKQRLKPATTTTKPSKNHSNAATAILAPTNAMPAHAAPPPARNLLPAHAPGGCLPSRSKRVNLKNLGLPRTPYSMKSNNLKPGSIASEAARLTIALKFLVTPDMIRWWRKKEYPLDDTDALLKRIKNQERGGPSKAKAHPASKAPTPPAPPASPASPIDIDIEGEMKQLQNRLINAESYDEARTIRMQIAGIRDVLKSLVEMEFYVTRESQVRDGLLISQAIRGEILKIPARLPQALVGLDYPAAVQKCEEFADHILAQLYDVGNYRQIETPV